MREGTQSQEERALFDDPTECILCASCCSVCPILAGENTRFIGPAATAQAARFVFDSRDRGFEERLDGVWTRESHFQCTPLCPRGIKVTRDINLIERKIRQTAQPAGSGS